MKGFVITVVILALLGVGIFIWLRQGSATASPEAATTTAKVERRDLKVEVKATGKVMANQEIPIKCKASGTVIALGPPDREKELDVNDAVTKGQVVLQLDTIDQDRAMKRAQAVLAASVAQKDQLEMELKAAQESLAAAKQTIEVNRMKANASLELAKAKAADAASKLNRLKELRDKKFVSGEDYETAQTVTKVAEMDVLTAEATVKDLQRQEMDLAAQATGLESQKAAIRRQDSLIKQNELDFDIQKQLLAYATVTSPVDGRVASLVSGNDSNNMPIYTRVGSMVQSGTGGFSGGTTVMTISDISQIKISANVDESEIRNVIDPQQSPPGTELQRVEITADAFKGVTFEGVVQRVALGGMTISNVVTIEVQIEVTSPNKHLLRPGMTANVTIIKARESKVLTVPVASVTLERDRFGGRGRGSAASTSSQPSTAPAAEAVAAATSESVATSPADSRPATRSGRPRKMDAAAALQGPHRGFVTVIKADGSEERRDVVVGESDGFYYKVISGLEEGETVHVPKAQAESRFRNSGSARPGAIMGGGGRPR